MSEPTTAAEFWESRYAGTERAWSGKVNAVLADVASDLQPGTALDLGCGEGGDVIWLAQHGWEALGVDISASAVERGRTAGAELGLPASRVRFQAADLTSFTTDEHFDLVTTSFLHSPFQLPREDILRRAASFVAPGGRLLITSHAAPPPWAFPEARKMTLPTPASELDALALDDAAWQVEVAETRDRSATGPDGTRATLTDGVVLVNRLR